MPRFYLNGFATDRGQLARVPLDGDRHLIAVGDATVQTDFYSLEGFAAAADAFERNLADLEAALATSLMKITIGNVWPLEPPDRYNIAGLVTLQFLRSASVRQGGEEVQRASGRLQVGVATTSQLREMLQLPDETPNADVEAIRAQMLATADTYEIGNLQHLKLIAEELESMTNLAFFRHPWVLITWSRKAVATSDTPVILVPSRDDPFGGVGFGTSAEIIYPLDRRRALLLGELSNPDDLPRQPPDYRAPGTAAPAETVNRLTLRNARREAFHHPEDDPFAGLEVPSPRSREMRTGDRQITDLIKAFAEQQGRPSGLPNPKVTNQ